MINRVLHQLLKTLRPTEIVDIGANPVDGDPPYRPMMNAGICRVTGFEPQEEALAELRAKMSAIERYLPYAVGDGHSHELKICRASGMTSLLEPDPSTLDLFEVLKPYGDVLNRVSIDTQRLDDIAEIQTIDFLKIDIQGGELAVFQHGRNKLAEAVAVQVEVSFITLYKNQPGLGEIDVELRRQGFIPHCFAAIKQWPIAPCVVNHEPRRALNQLLEADLVYMRDFSKPESMHDEQLKHLALIAHYCYRSFDLVLRCVMLLERRGSLPPGSQGVYLRSLQAPATRVATF